jgi:hypothetical protein
MGLLHFFETTPVTTHSTNAKRKLVYYSHLFNKMVLKSIK